MRTKQSHLHFASEACIAARVATIPAGRLAEPADAVDACLFLASSRAGYVNGTHLPRPLPEQDFKETEMKLNRRAGALLWGLWLGAVFGGAMWVYRPATSEPKPDPGSTAATPAHPIVAGGYVCPESRSQWTNACIYVTWQPSYANVSWQALFQGARR